MIDIDDKEIEALKLLELFNQIEKDEQYEKSIQNKNNVNETIYTVNDNLLNKDVLECIACNTDEYIMHDEDKGTTLCSNCGAVLDNTKSISLEWREYPDGSGNASRCSYVTNIFMPQSSLGTSIGGNKFNKMKQTHLWGQMPYRERSLNEVFKIIKAVCNKNNILKIVQDEAQSYYYNISKCKSKVHTDKFLITRGENRKSIIASCVYLAAKKNGYTLSLKDIARYFEVDYTDATKGLKLCIKLIKQINIDYKIKYSVPVHYVTRYCKLLKIYEYIDICENICKNIKAIKLAAKHTPTSVAAGTILLVVDHYKLPITKSDIARETTISQVTIQKIFLKLKPYKYIILNKNINDYIVNLINIQKQKHVIPQQIKINYNEFLNFEKKYAK